MYDKHLNHAFIAMELCGIRCSVIMMKHAHLLKKGFKCVLLCKYCITIDMVLHHGNCIIWAESMTAVEFQLEFIMFFVHV